MEREDKDAEKMFAVRPTIASGFQELMETGGLEETRRGDVVLKKKKRKGGVGAGEEKGGRRRSEMRRGRQEKTRCFHDKFRH